MEGLGLFTYNRNNFDRFAKDFMKLGQFKEIQRLSIILFTATSFGQTKKNGILFYESEKILTYRGLGPRKWQLFKVKSRKTKFGINQL